MAVAASAAGGTLALPSAPTVSAAPGDDDGEVTLTVSALPASWGDLILPGDEEGEAGILQWWNGEDGWQELANPAATGAFDVSLPAMFWSETTTLRVRGVSAAGRNGIAVSVRVAVPPIAPGSGLGSVWPDDSTVWPDDATAWPEA